MNRAIVRTEVANVTDNTSVDLRGASASLLIVFNGSTSGSVAVTARVIGGQRFNAITDGEIDLSERDYVYVPAIPLSAVYLSYDGIAPLSATIFQLP